MNVPAQITLLFQADCLCIRSLRPNLSWQISCSDWLPKVPCPVDTIAAPCWLREKQGEPLAVRWNLYGQVIHRITVQSLPAARSGHARKATVVYATARYGTDVRKCKT
jgi:hypothetical protein